MLSPLKKKLQQKQMVYVQTLHSRPTLPLLTAQDSALLNRFFPLINKVCHIDPWVQEKHAKDLYKQGSNLT